MDSVRFVFRSVGKIKSLSACSGVSVYACFIRIGDERMSEQKAWPISFHVFYFASPIHTLADVSTIFMRKDRTKDAYLLLSKSTQNVCGVEMMFDFFSLFLEKSMTWISFVLKFRCLEKIKIRT